MNLDYMSVIRPKNDVFCGKMILARVKLGFLQNSRKQQNLCKSALNCESVGECCEFAIGCDSFSVRGYVHWGWTRIALRQ
jgi:hypothetical protein